MMTGTLKAPEKKFSQWFVEIYKEEGLIGFYKGGLTRVVFMGMGGFMYFLLYAEFIRILNLEDIHSRIRNSHTD